MTPSRAPAPLRWTSWAPADEPVASLALLVLMVVVAAAVVAATGHPLAGLAALIVSLAATARHWARTSYETARDGVRVEFLGRVRRLPWGAIDHWYAGPRGAWLVGPPCPLPWQQIGGLFCPWPAEPQVFRAALEHYLGPAAGGMGPPEDVRASKQASNPL